MSTEKSERKEKGAPNQQQPSKNPKEPATFLDENWSWSDFSSWPLSVKFSPIVVVFIGIWISVYYQYHFGDSYYYTPAHKSCVANFDYTFNIEAAQRHAEESSTHNWEIGTAAEALLEFVNPERSVFGRNPFPGGKVPAQWFTMEHALVYAQQHSRVEDLTMGGGIWGAADPAALGVSAVMIGRHWGEWRSAAAKLKRYLLTGAPRYGNGAISHRTEVAELWADAVFMFPPFLAYYAVATNDLELMRESVRQIGLYRDVLLIREGERKGLWRHIIGPSEKADDGAWSTGNGWAAYGMARVRATIASWRPSGMFMQAEIAALDGYIFEIIDAAMRTDNDESKVLRNYLGDDSWFGETSGTALLAAAAYRLGMVTEPGPKRSRMLTWADDKRKAVSHKVDDDGIAKPAVNSTRHDQREPIHTGSPEGESFLLLMGAAWRDCVCSDICSPDP